MRLPASSIYYPVCHTSQISLSISFHVIDGAELRHRVQYFADSDRVDSTPYIRLIRASQGYIEHAASHILAKIISVKPNVESMQALIDWVVQCLNLGENAHQLSDPARSSSARAAVGALMALLRNEKARDMFTDANGVKLLADVLHNAAGRAQLTYELCFDLWTLTFCEKAVRKFGSTGALAALIKQIIAAPREKIVRVILAAFRNLLGKNNGTFNETMIEAGLIKTLNQMKERKWSDEDIRDDVNVIRDVLLCEFKVLTTMERYEKEIETGQLAWGLLHTDKFWRANYMDFERQDFGLIKMLIELLNSQDETTVSVALNDLGEFVRYYPNGKMIAKKLGAKQVVMQLLTEHEAAEVKKHALHCMSKMMVNKWEFVK